MTYKRFVFLFAAFIIWQSCCGQWFGTTYTFTTQNGLSNNTATCLKKDEAGFLWVGTHEGLNRYDGTAFINVLSNAKNNLPSNNITSLFFISKSLLAVGTDAGLCLLNTTTLTGRRIDIPVLGKFSYSGYYIQNLSFKKESKELWVATWHGLFVLNEEGKILRQMMAAATDMTRGRFADCLMQDGHGGMYFFSQQKNGFYYADFAAQQLVPVEKKMPGFTWNALLHDKYNLMSAVANEKESVCIFSRKTEVDRTELLAYNNRLTGRNFVDKLSISFEYEKRLASAYPLNDTTFLLNSYFGEPLLYNTTTHFINRVASHPLWFTSWPDGISASICKDDENIWVASSKGLVQAPLKTNFFTSAPALINEVNKKKGLVSYNYGIYKNHSLWVAGMGAGLFGWDSLNNSVKTVFDKATPAASVKKIISTYVSDAGACLWLFSVYGPVQVNPLTKCLSPVDGIDKDPAFDESASFPLADSKGNIWASLPDGLSKFNIASRRFTNYKSRYYGGTFPLLRSGAKAEDGNGNIWMARQDTLVKLSVATNSFLTRQLTKNGQALRPVTSMASDGGDVLYLAVGGDFGIYHISSGSIDLYTKQTGIVSTVINDIAADAQGNAWIATEGGLVFYNKQKAAFSSFTKADGLPDDNIVGANFTDSSRQTLFLGFTKSYCLLKPQNFLLQKAVPFNYITGVEADGESFAADEKQTFSYRQNSLSFTYTGINYNQGQQNSYACMLEGFDQEWKYTGAERKINYINLPAGKYRFKIKSANHQGEWNEEPAVFTFEITPPFWQRWWFRALMIGLALYGVYYFMKRRDASIQKQNNLKLQMSELRMQALRAQMNPHFIFNSLNSIQNYILSHNTIDAAGYLSKFAKLMRRILDGSKHNFLPLSDVMETLKMYVEMEAFRFNNEFTYSFIIEEDDDLLDAKVPPMLFQPFVENAVLHGLMPKQGEKKLTIRCSKEGDHAVIIIEDNGVGRQYGAKAGHTSQGEKLTVGILESWQQLQNNKASMNITDKIENGLPAGTLVTLTLPLN